VVGRAACGPARWAHAPTEWKERSGWASSLGEPGELTSTQPCEVSDVLMERYLEGGEIFHEEIVGALKEGTNYGRIFPVVCGCATRNLGTTRLLDAIVEDLPSPVKHGSLRVGEVELRLAQEEELFAYVFKTRVDQFAGRINLLRVYQGVLRADSQVLNTHAHLKERIGQLLVFKGKQIEHVQEGSSVTVASRSSRLASWRSTIPSGPSFEFVDQIKGGVIPGSFIPAVEKGVRRRCARPSHWPTRCCWSRSCWCACPCPRITSETSSAISVADEDVRRAWSRWVR
jgi:translation elongation factor EF-G